jgi:hypothetical protein
MNEYLYGYVYLAAIAGGMLNLPEHRRREAPVSAAIATVLIWAGASAVGMLR